MTPGALGPESDIGAGVAPRGHAHGLTVHSRQHMHYVPGTGFLRRAGDTAKGGLTSTVVVVRTTSRDIPVPAPAGREIEGPGGHDPRSPLKGGTIRIIQCHLDLELTPRGQEEDTAGETVTADTRRGQSIAPDERTLFPVFQLRRSVTIGIPGVAQPQSDALEGGIQFEPARPHRALSIRGWGSCRQQH